MDSWEFNKIAGAVLTALLIAFGSGTFAAILASSAHDEHGEKKVGYKLPVTAAVDTGGKGVPAAPEFNADQVIDLLKTASADSGRSVFNQCRACHVTEKGAKPTTGPDLWGIIGRDVASSPDFPRYSQAMKGQTGKWDYKHLIEYLRDPKKMVPGNLMAFAGVKNTQQLADLVAYLRTLSDQPAPLPN
jgi:cytochrome c